MRRLGARPDRCRSHATRFGAEIDLLVTRGRRRFGFEMRRTWAPGITKSTRVVMDDLDLDRIDVVHGGDETFPSSAGIRALGSSRVLAGLEPR
jgi:hypothetical protein